MEKIEFSMNVYFKPNNIIKESVTVQERVLDRMEENDCQDLYNSIDRIEDESVYDILGDFIEKSTMEELKPFISVDEDSIRFDEYETSECDHGWLAYLVDVTLDIEKILMQINEERASINEEKSSLDTAILSASTKVQKGNVQQNKELGL